MREKSWLTQSNRALKQEYGREFRRAYPKMSHSEIKAGFIRADRIDKELDRGFKLAVDRPNT